VLAHGEEQLAIVAEGSSADAPGLRAAIAEEINATIGLRVARVAVVRVGSLPRTSSGKLQRRRTQQLFEQELLEEHAS